MFTRPPFKLESVRLESLLFPPACQQRAGLTCVVSNDAAVRAACWERDDAGNLVCVADPKVAREMADALADGAQFDALDVVREASHLKKRSEPRLIVFGGFTRGAAYKLYGKIHSVPCNVYEGTLEDARFWSLSENYRSVQARGHGSARKAIETLLDSAMLMERVRPLAKSLGGLGKAIAAATQTSYSLVCVVLRDRNLSIDGTRLTARAPKHSNETPTFATLDNSQTSATESAAPPAVVPPEPDEPLYTVPADFGHVPPAAPIVPDPLPVPAAPHAEPDGINGGLIVEVKDRIADGRDLMNAAIGALREADEAVRALLGSIAGPLLDRATVGGVPVLCRRNVRERRGTGTVERSVICSAVAPAVLAAILLRTRPRTVCAGCMGAGCVSCRGLGFVPDDDSLIREDRQQAFDFGDAWDGEEGV